MHGLTTHRATFVWPTVSAGDYGHSGYDYDNPAASETVACRAVQLDQAEWERLGFSGQALYDMMLIVPATEMPTAATALGESATVRIITVTTAEGEPFASGAIDVEEITPILGPFGRVEAWRVFGRFAA